MSLVALDGTPLVAIGQMIQGSSMVPGVSNTTQDATGEACHQIGQVFWTDGGSHTIDTTGSSSIGWRAGSVTLSNVASVFKAGLATVDTATGPPGRATNVADIITFSVSRTYTSLGKPTTTSWNETVPDTGTITIAHGDTIAFCTQMVTRAGTDTINTVTGTVSTAVFPFKTDFTGGAYAAVNSVPNAVITASDGTVGWFWAGCVFTTTSNARTWNNTSSPSEFGNLFALPFPAKIYGLLSNISLGGNADVNLYSSPLGTPVAEKSMSFDLNVIAAVSAVGSTISLFTSPYTTVMNQQIGAVITPTSATNVTNNFITLNTAAHQSTFPGGANGYAISRSGGSGAFAAVNSSKDRQAICLLVGAFDNGSSGPVGQQCM